MILAAGLGTRLLPYTKERPKPLFPIAGRPLLDILIRKLENAGCGAVIVNTHHLAEKIDSILKDQHYSIPIQTRYEPTILGTGGAIKNVEDFWDQEPFIVVNGDILTDIALDIVFAFHKSHGQPVTMVLHDHAQFNSVWVDSDDQIAGFGWALPDPKRNELRCLAFTGIHVIDPSVLKCMEPGRTFSIIDTYESMIATGIKPRAFVAQGHTWHDIGTIEGYRTAARQTWGQEILSKQVGCVNKPSNETPYNAANKLERGCVSGLARDIDIAWSKLKGDGSDRIWYRACASSTSIILAEHDLNLSLNSGDEACEADSFCAIGAHLRRRGVSVPLIYGYDRPTGLVAVEDLGDTHLQDIIQAAVDPAQVVRHYQNIIDLLVHMATEASGGFDPEWTFQTSHYNRELILERECGYFLEAYLKGYKKLDIHFEDLRRDFENLARGAVATKYVGFLHRDFQSRNIMVKADGYYVIDFQGGRIGPVQYDLASLLIDPYVALPPGIQQDLVHYYIQRLSRRIDVTKELFLDGYRYCSVTRNLQILGAFSFLSKVKNKPIFESYIPAALASLRRNLQRIDPKEVGGLMGIIDLL